MKRLALLLVLTTCSSPPPQHSNLPPDPPTNQRVTPVSGGSHVSWKKAVDDDLDLTFIARYADPAPHDGHPEGKEAPKPPSKFGSGLVVYTGSASQLDDFTLPEGCGTFTYQLWSHDSAGHFSGGGVTATTLPGALAAPTLPPSGFTATRVAGNVILQWGDTHGAPGTRVVRKLGSSPVTPDQGVLVSDGPGATATEPIAALPVGQSIFYAAFACNACGSCSLDSAKASLIILPDDAGVPDAGPDDPDGGSPLQPSALTTGLSTDGQSVSLSWTNPDVSTGFTQVLVLRQLNALPTGPDDANATAVFTGLATTASERLDLLLPDVAGGTARTYFYVVYGCAGAVCERHGARLPFKFTVSQALHGGGYTLWWRHASASTCGDATNLGACTCTGGTCTNCPASNWWKSCDTSCTTATARQLTPPQSTLETTTIHDQFASKGIGVGRVLASEMCRGVQTAQGMNFGPAIEQVQELTYFVYDEANRCTNTYAMLNTPPAQGLNTAMISHAGFTCPIIDSLNWAECAIFKPQPGGAQFITRVNYNQWATLP